MIRRTLIQMIEDHSDQITARVIRQIKQDPELVHAGKIPEWDLRDRATEILKNLGRWLSTKQEVELAKRYEWQAMVAGKTGLWGPWAASSYFTGAAVPGLVFHSPSTRQAACSCAAVGGSRA